MISGGTTDNIKNQEYKGDFIEAFEEQFKTGTFISGRNRIYRNSSNRKSISFELSQEVSKQIFKISNGVDIATFIVLLSGIEYLIYKYSNESEIITFVPESICGKKYFGNGKGLSLFLEVDGVKTIKELIKSIKDKIVKIQKNDFYYKESIQENYKKWTVKHETTGIFICLESLFNFENLQCVNYECTFCFRIKGQIIECNLSYNSDLFNDLFITRLVGHLKMYYKALSEDVNRSLVDISIITQEEKKEILLFSEGERLGYPKEKTIQELFEAQVNMSHNQIAVECGHMRLTYDELNCRANQVARLLRASGIQKEEVVTILMDRTIDLVIAILGILKAGGAYLPIDYKLPNERIEYMLTDSKARILISNHYFIGNVKFNGNILYLDTEKNCDLENNNLDNINSSSDMAYVIYTSGSTGKPKGVMIEHRSLSNLLYGLYYKYNEEFNSKDKCLSVANISFDASVMEIFLPLIFGSTLVLYDNELVADVEHLINVIINHKITYMFIPPSIIKDLAKGLYKMKHQISLNKLFIGVEPIAESIVEEYFNINSNMQIVNAYGPTETTICASLYKCSPKGTSQCNISIGSPVINNDIYIIDVQGQLAPIGIKGELCVSGIGVSRGYLNQDNLTKDKFVDNPFKQGEKLYRTGDIARWLSNGNIEFIGRIDTQIKINGYRVELSEIENTILRYIDRCCQNEVSIEPINKFQQASDIYPIKQVVMNVISQNNNDKYLCAYFVAEQEILTNRLRSFLEDTLPYYMIPRYILQVDKMPINRSGKVERRLLPIPTMNKRSRTEHIEPINEVQKILQSIWIEILDNDNIGILDNFFELGGNSLKATTLIIKIKEQFEIEIRLKDIFKNLTIKNLEEYINSCERRGQQLKEYERIEKAESKEYYLTSPSQKTMFIASSLSEDVVVYNVPRADIIYGDLDVFKLENAFKSVISRHEGLRTSFHLINDNIFQKVHDTVNFNINYIEASEKNINKLIRELIRIFDLETPPLLRVSLIKIGAKKHLFFWDTHHIIIDGLSMGILLKEISILYNGGELPPVKYQYKDYSEWRDGFKNSREWVSQKEYWTNIYKNEIQAINMPIDFQRSKVRRYHGDTISIQIDDVLTNKVEQLARGTCATVYMVLLTAYFILLFKNTYQEDIVVGTPIAGRGHVGFDEIVGALVNTLAIRTYPSMDKSAYKLLNEVVESCLDAYKNQDYHLDELVVDLQLERIPGRNTIFDTMFVMQDKEYMEMQLKDLNIINYKFSQSASMFDILLETVTVNNRINCKLDWNISLFNRDRMVGFLDDYEMILRAMVRDINLPIEDIIHAKNRIFK